MEDPTVSEKDLEAISSQNHGIVLMQEVFEQVSDRPSLMIFMMAYLRWSRVFDAAVPLLTARINIFETRNGLRKKANRTIDDLLLSPARDIADFVALAGMDEIGNPEKRQPAHRILAARTIKRISEFPLYGSNPNESRLAQDSEIDAIEDLVLEGYGHEQPLDETNLLENIGFHLESEALAAKEFETLNRLILNGGPLERHLREDKYDERGYKIDSTAWLEIHRTAEPEHEQAALVAANLALAQYSSVRNPKAQLLAGAKAMIDLQTRFFDHLKNQILKQTLIVFRP